jgi:hypothetical protein
MPMPMNRRPPIAAIAMSEFQRSFPDLISVVAQVIPFDKTLIEEIYERVLWFGRTEEDYKSFEKTARVAYSFLNQGSLTKYTDVAQQFLRVVNDITPALNRSLESSNEATKVAKDDFDTRIKNYLVYYKTMYEGLLPIVLSPVIYAFGIAKHKNDKKLVPRADGKIDLGALKVVGKWSGTPENRLAIGLNNHLRNAYAHEQYRILDDGKVELWDIDPHRPNNSWGPEIWDIEQIVKICDQLWFNALGIVCGLVIFHINNHKGMEGKGLALAFEPSRLRRHELKDAIESLSNELSFELKKVELSPLKTDIGLSTMIKGIDQEEQIRFGYSDGTECCYKRPVKYEEKRVIDQTVTLLYRLIPYFDIKTKVQIQVFSPDQEEMGILATDLSTLVNLKFQGSMSKGVDLIRHSFEFDTIGNANMYVRKENSLKRVSARG